MKIREDLHLLHAPLLCGPERLDHILPHRLVEQPAMESPRVAIVEERRDQIRAIGLVGGVLRAARVYPRALLEEVLCDRERVDDEDCFAEDAETDDVTFSQRPRSSVLDSLR